MKENGFKLGKERSRRYPATAITDADNVDDIALLANTPTQAETLLHSPERAACGIGPHLNADKTDYTCFDQLTKGWSFETGGQILLSRKQRFINQERHQHATSKGMNS